MPDNVPIHHEPARFGMTGANFAARNLHADRMGEAFGYALDAPEHIAAGGVTGTMQYAGTGGAAHYLSHTLPRRSW